MNPFPPDHPPLIVDSFAGGGGASTGIEMALGRSPDIAINHNPVALAMHAANHPATLHLSENVWQVDPLDYCAGRHVGLAWFSPDCKHFSKAKGGKPVERNIRDLAWVVVLWAERARPDVILLENVEEFRDWGPLIETDRGLMPDPAARGKTFEHWLRQLKKLGYRVEWRELRACDYGAPTIRKRLFLIARCDGNKIVWPKPTHYPPASRDAPEAAPPVAPAGRGKGRDARSGLRAAPDRPDYSEAKRPWRTAAEIIDWSLPCPSIFASSEEILADLGLRAVRPLAAATMSRVARGVKRYVLDAKQPFLVNLTHGVRLEDPAEPINTVTGAHRGEKAVVAPSVVRFNTGATGHAVDQPLATVTANSFIKRPGGAAPLGVVAPVLSYGQQGGGNRSAEEPHHTITASAKDQNAMIAPTLVQTGYGERDGQAPRALDIEAPLATAVAGGVKHAVVTPTLVGCGGRAGQSRPRGGDEPAATITAKADVCVAAAYLAQHNTGVVGHAAREPVSTIVGKGCTQGVVAASLMSMKGADRRDSVADAPHPTVLAGGGHSAVVAPFFQKYYGTGDGQRADEPCHTVTVKDRLGYVEGDVRPEPLTEAQLARARQVAAFLREHGHWDGDDLVTVEIPATSRKPDRASGEARPAGAPSAREAEEVETWTIVDIGMRMLTPRELFSAQGFPPGYRIDFQIEGKVHADGTRLAPRKISKSEQISCCGNSVSPPVAAALAAANCGHLAVYAEAAE